MKYRLFYLFLVLFVSIYTYKVGESEDFVTCPDGCDCQETENGTEPCASDVVLCTGVEPTYPINPIDNKPMGKCGSAFSIEAEWPKGCKSATYTKIKKVYSENGDYEEIPETFFWDVNCSSESKECKTPVTCKVVPNGPQKVKCETGERSGDISSASKRDVYQCENLP